MNNPKVNVVVSGHRNEYHSTYKTYILRGGVPFADQVIMPDTKYVIKWDFDLDGKTITVPSNCILEFDGGSLKNGTIIGQDTVFINVGDVDIWGENLTREGTWREKQGGGIPDKEYDPEHNSGLGRKTLELDGDSNVLTQEDFDKENTIYVISYDFDLNGGTIEIPEGCTLEFDGGSLNNGSLVGDVVVLNMPDDFYENVNCFNLYVSNIEHISYDNTIDTYWNNRRHHQNRRGSKTMYSLQGITKIFFTVGSNTQSGAWITFYDKDRREISTLYNISYETDITGYVNNGAVYAMFVLSVWQNHIQDMEEYLNKIYISLIDLPCIDYFDSYYNDFDKDGIPTGHLDVLVNDNEQTPVYIEASRNSEYYAEYRYFADSAETTSICIPYSVFKNYDYLAVTPKEDSFTQVHFLKKEPVPKNNREKVTYSDWYSAPVYVAQGDYTSYYRIANDIRYIVIYCKWKGGDMESPYVRTPRRVQLCTKQYLGIDKFDNDPTVNSLARHYYKSLDFVHWNIGNFSNGKPSTDITDENYNRKLAAFNKFTSVACKSCNFLLNEYNSVFAKLNSGKVYTPSVLFWQYWHTKSFIRANNTDELAVFAQNSLAGYKVGELTSLSGMFSEIGNYYLIPKPYVIYRYFIGLDSLYILHTHLPTKMSVEQYRTVYADMVSIMSTYSNVIILGDFNCSDRNALDVFTDAGYSIGNPIDSEPTHASGVTLDWCVYRGNFSLTNFRVRTDAIDENAEDTPEDPRMLSDHWPISFSVSYNSSVVPVSKGSSFYNESLKKPQWSDGENARDANGELIGIRRSGTTAQRPGTEAGTENPVNIGFPYYDTSVENFVFWNGNNFINPVLQGIIKIGTVTGETSSAGNHVVRLQDTSQKFVIIAAWCKSGDTLVFPYAGGMGDEHGQSTWYLNVRSSNDLTPLASTDVTLYYAYIEL